MSNDEAWLALILLLYSTCEQGKEINFNDVFKQEKANEQFRRNCPSVEWEQDMQASIPFCKLDGEMCNMQCRNRNNYTVICRDISERRI